MAADTTCEEQGIHPVSQQDCSHACIALGFKYLHNDLNKTLIHRDLKPDNVLVSADMQSKVADFGESRFFDEKMAKAKGVSALTMSQVGTMYYLAPEVHARATCTLFDRAE